MKNTDMNTTQEDYIECLHIGDDNFEEAIKKIEDKNLIINSVLETKISAQARIVELITTLGLKPTITSLSLEIYNRGDEEIEILAQALKLNTTLTHLILDITYIDDRGMESLAQALEVNTTLTHIDLRPSCRGDKWADKLAKVLLVNTTLISLHLMGTNISVQGAELLAKALEVNKTLTHLCLCENNIGAQGAESIAASLKVNTALTSLDLGRNSISMSTTLPAAVIELLKTNTALTCLNLGDIINISTLSIAELNQGFKENLHLTKLAPPSLASGINHLLTRNEGIFNEVVKIIKTPNLKEDPMANNVKGRHYKFFQEAPEIVFHKALGLNYSTCISNFKNIISQNFFFFSRICKTAETSKLPKDVWKEIAKHLKLGDVSLDHVKQDASSELPNLANTDTHSDLLGNNAESEC
jgi:hypothetical protein